MLPAARTGRGVVQHAALKALPFGQPRGTARLQLPSATSNRPLSSRRLAWGPSHIRRLQTTSLREHGLDNPVSPPHAEDTTALLGLTAKLSRQIAGEDVSLHCTEINDKGTVSQADQVLSKHAIASSYDVHTRDLRNIDQHSESAPYIFVRPTTIIVNLYFVRLLIQSNRILVISLPENAPSTFGTQAQNLFVSTLEDRLRKPSNQPFEFRALEAALITIVCYLEAEYLLAREPARAALHELQDKIDIERSQLQDLLHHSRRMSALSNQARLVRGALQEVLSVDEDLAEMYLTDTSLGNPHKLLDHTEAEVLLEAYCKVCDRVAEAAGSLNAAISKTEDNLKSMLDAHRNQIMLLDIRLNIGMLGLSSGTLVAGLYGMNLVNGIEEASWGFPVVAGCCLGLSSLFMLYGGMRVRKLNSLRIGPRSK